MNAVFSAILKLAAIIFLGWVLRKRGLIEDKALKFLTFLTVNISVPCLFFSRLVKNSHIVTANSPFGFLFLSAVIFLAGWFLSWSFTRGRECPCRDEYMGLVSFQNAGYLPMNMALYPSSRRDFTVKFLPSRVFKAVSIPRSRMP